MTSPIRLSLFYTALFCFMGVLLPFWPVWLKARGLSPEDIGLLFGLATFIRIITNPLIAQEADRRGSRKPFMIALSAASFVIFLIYFRTESFWPILLVTLAFNACWGALMPLAESLTFMKAKIEGFQYGRIRLWGSLAFIVSAAFAGWVISEAGEEVIMPLSASALALTFLVALYLPRSRAQKAVEGRNPMAPLFRNRPFLLIMIAAALIQSSHAVYYGFATIHWRGVGYSDTLIGFLWAEGVIAEIVLFTYGTRLIGRIGPAKMVLIAGLVGIVRWTLTGASDSLSVLIIVQSLHAFTFGAAHLGAVHYISANIPEELSATAQSIYSAVVMGIAMGVMMILAGHLYGAFNAGAFYFVALLAAVGVGLAAVQMRIDKQM